MKYEVEKDTLRKTSSCYHDFSCLKGNKECLCDVTSDIDGKLLFVNAKRMKLCSYLITYGYSFICNCPTRKEIFATYKI